MGSNSLKTGLKQHWYSLDLKSELQIPVWISIITVFILSLLDLAGWKFDVVLFKSIIPGWIPMKIITALCFILAATSLLIIQFDFPAIIKKILPRVFAVLICLTSLITIYVYFYSIITGHEISLSGASYFNFFLLQPGRMALLSALSFLSVV